ncbi:Trafficking protein particle complex subunit 10 [Ophiocordyceps camponoti-floridani]|uniref:Trafficking protein particle complex subunit 10 n=1 Tax=Ophiocordyceps camponoti-floridani TaxID=2030778 RepID=A0A8H4VBU7_9HYPO|nr:Trafficking protein particle complex subunit 10 [Ophiocordyceps camponoti-floridani]
MDQQTSTSTVTVEYFDPHNVYNLMAPGLMPRLPLHNLHWQSHSGPLRSIETLHVELVAGGAGAPPSRRSDTESASRDDGFRAQHVGGRIASSEVVSAPAVSTPPSATGGQRRHQIPGLRRTPYLKMLLVRCDDNESYKTSVRSEIREWIKHNAPSSTGGSKKGKEKHDAFEWLIIHVVLPNTAAATQPRSGRLSEGGAGERTSASSRWRSGTTPLLEKLRSDFNSSGKGSPDRVAQIRIGINDVPYDQLPRVVPAMPSGYSETDQDAENAWNNLVAKFKSLILTSFDRRVSQYEEDIKEKDAQRTLPGWNFCTFFILKEGLARGFESVGLVEDALVGYDELAVGLDLVMHGQAMTGLPEQPGGAMLAYTEELKQLLRQAREVKDQTVTVDGGDVEVENLQQSGSGAAQEASRDDIIVISSTKKAYRDMILENKVSVFDFRCYIFSRQMSLLLRQGNASSTREELLAKLKAQQDSVLRGIAPLAAPTRHDEEPENLVMLAEVCRRTLEFIPSISHVMRQDLLAEQDARDAATLAMIDNLVSSFAFSVAQQILAQTWSRALPIPPTALGQGSSQEPKTSMPEPKVTMHPARSSSLHAPASPRRAPSPGGFPGPGRRASVSDGDTQSSRFLKIGLEELAARRAELYLLSRSVLSGLGKRRGWSDGWVEAPTLDEKMDDVDLGVADGKVQGVSDDEMDLGDGMRVVSEVDLGQTRRRSSRVKDGGKGERRRPVLGGLQGQVLRTAMDGADDFYRLYEILTDKALRHYAMANYEHAVQSCAADLGCLKYQLKEYRAAAGYFHRTTPFFGEDGWSSLELSMLMMHSRCLLEMKSDDEFVRVALKLLVKACTAAKTRLREKPSAGGRGRVTNGSPPLDSIVDRLFGMAKSLPREMRVPLVSLFTDVRLEGAPTYEDGRDACFVSVDLFSLSPREMVTETAKMVATSGDGSRAVTFEMRSPFRMVPGRNRVKLECKSVIPGLYSVSHLSLRSSKLMIHHDRRPDEPEESDIFPQAKIRLFQRTSSFDVQVKASNDVVLDQNGSLDVEVSTGWNELKSCELRLKPATGGLRLLTTETRVVESTVELVRRPEGGTLALGPLREGVSVKLRVPYSVELDMAQVVIKVEATYVDQAGETFFLAKTPTVTISLAVGVNVQDVFKHEVLLSRFSVSTATASPVYLYDSSLRDSDLFEASFGTWPAEHAVALFPKQPASLLYRIKRKKGSVSRANDKAGRTMHLRLCYAVLQTEMEALVRDSVTRTLGAEPALAEYARLAADCAASEVRARLQGHHLERAALTGWLSAATVLEGVVWARELAGLGVVAGTGRGVEVVLGEALDGWVSSHGMLEVPTTTTTTTTMGKTTRKTMTIPVEVPSVSVVHTADIRLDSSSVFVNQPVTATLLLRWTRAWDTETRARTDQEFTYEVTSPPETWLLGGRRKGHFIIPLTDALPSPHLPGSFTATASSSAPETEACIPILLIPQREGRLPFPAVEIYSPPGINPVTS